MWSTSIRKLSQTVLNTIKSGPYSMATMSSTVSKIQYETLQVTSPEPFIYHVELNRPAKLNAFNKAMWREIGECFQNLHLDPDCRVVILSGAGKLFTAGIDLNDMMELAPQLAEVDDVARKAKILTSFIHKYQDGLTSLEKCNKPVLTATHSACVGAGVDLITAADMRYCTKDAWFQIKETAIGMAADVGTLQRLPKVVGSDSLVRELCYTARKLPASEALSCGLVSKVFDDKDSMMSGTMEIARDIASKSPVAIQVTKASLVYSRDHSVQEGLDNIAMWNKCMLQSEDFSTAVIGQATKQKDIVFSKL